MSKDEFEPISPEEARRRLDDATAPYLSDGWVLMTRHDYMARLTRGPRNLDFYVDLKGDVTTDEQPISPVQDSGRLVAWLLLILSLVLAVAIASALGLLR